MFWPLPIAVIANFLMFARGCFGAGLRNRVAFTRGLRLRRFNSGDAAPKKQPRMRFIKGLLTGVGAGLAIPAIYLAAFFLYDSSTYREGPLEISCSVSDDALNLKRGGPKNLPIANAFMDDDELGNSGEKRPRLVILGSGWGAVSLLKSLNPGNYDITVISPTNHFLFTPLLPSAATGTLSLDSLVEPIRDLCRKKEGRYLEGAASDVEFDEKLVEVRNDPNTENFYVKYDKLIIASGATANTHSVPGVEHCFPFKTAEDAQKLRMKICQNLEQASLPATTDIDRRRLLSFVVCGGGPTGVELAAEIYDLLKEDVPKYFPRHLVNLASVHVIQSRSAILNTYDESISEYAMKRFMKDGIDLQTNSRVQEVTGDSVIFAKNVDGQRQVYELPSGLTMWTTGVGLTRLVKRVMSKLASSQHNRRAIETDSHLRVIGTKPGEVYAIGDCSTLRTNLCEELSQLLSEEMRQHMDRDTVEKTLLQIAKDCPHVRQHVIKLRDKLHRWYEPGELISYETVRSELQKVDSKVTSLPATAQRASQQGIYMGNKLNRLAVARPSMVLKSAAGNDIDQCVYRPFTYYHLGSLAYISNAAVFDTKSSVGFNFGGGIVAMYLWRGVYLSETVSARSRLHMFFDWLYRGLFGRQVYSYDRVAK